MHAAAHSSFLFRSVGYFNPSFLAMQTASTASHAFGAFLSAIHQGGCASFWFRLLVPDGDKITSIEDGLAPDKREQRVNALSRLNMTSL